MNSDLPKALSAVRNNGIPGSFVYEKQYRELVDIGPNEPRRYLISTPAKAGFDSMIGEFETLAKQPTREKHYFVCKLDVKKIWPKETHLIAEEYHRFWRAAVEAAADTYNDVRSVTKQGIVDRFKSGVQRLETFKLVLPWGIASEVGIGKAEPDSQRRAEAEREKVHQKLAANNLDIVVAIDLCEYVGHRPTTSDRSAIYESFIDAFNTVSLDHNARVHFLVRISSIMKHPSGRISEKVFQLKAVSQQELLDILTRKLAAANLQVHEVFADLEAQERLIYLSSGNIGYLVKLFSAAAETAIESGAMAIRLSDVEQAGDKLGDNLLPVDPEDGSSDSLFEYYFGSKSDETGLNPYLFKDCFTSQLLPLEVKQWTKDETLSSDAFHIVKNDKWLNRAIKEGWLGISSTEIGPAHYSFLSDSLQPTEAELKAPSNHWIWLNELLFTALRAGRKKDASSIQYDAQLLREDSPSSDAKLPKWIVMPDFLGNPVGSSRKSRIATLIESNRDVWIPGWVFVLPQIGGYEGLSIVRHMDKKGATTKSYAYIAKTFKAPSGKESQFWYRFPKVPVQSKSGQIPTIDVKTIKFQLTRQPIDQPGIDISKAVGNTAEDRIRALFLAHEDKFIWGSVLQREDVGGTSAQDTIRTISSFTKKKGRTKDADRINIHLNATREDVNSRIRHELWQEQNLSNSGASHESQEFLKFWSSKLPNDQRLDFLNGRNGWYVYSRRFAPQGQV